MAEITITNEIIPTKDNIALNEEMSHMLSITQPPVPQNANIVVPKEWLYGNHILYIQFENTEYSMSLHLDNVFKHLIKKENSYDVI